jgi:hypothetical protein
MPLEPTMIRLRPAIHTAVMVSLIGLGTVAAGQTATPQVDTMTAQLSGASEVPPVASSASASVQAQLDRGTRKLTWTIVHSGLSGSLTAAHFHGPASAGENAGVAVPLAGSLDSPINGSATISEAQMADLLAGKWYLNLHTAAHPSGEIRGQVMVRP